MTDLTGKVAVVTGGGSGIGRATCLALAARGARVAVADLREQTAKETTELVLGQGGFATPHLVDVADEQSVRDLAAAVLAEHGGVDVLVNNAGIGVETVPTVDTELDVYRAVLDVNLWGVLHGVKAFLPQLLTRPRANIVNVCSFAGLMGMTQMSPYNVSKFGVRGFTEALQMEFNGTSLTVSIVYPGATRTPLMSNSPTVDEAKRDLLSKNLMNAANAVPAEKVAAGIVDAVLKDRSRVLVGTDTKGIDKVVRLLPSRYPRIMAPQLKKLIDKALSS